MPILQNRRNAKHRRGCPCSLNGFRPGKKELSIPFITISMGKLGAVSRICGETFGSCITFGAGTDASAPGQIPATQLRKILELL